MHKLYRNESALQAVLLAFMLLIYGGILFKGTLHNWPLDITFNSMAERLLHGRFDVDPNIIGVEGFARGGHVYSYWGIYGALLRIPLILLHQPDKDITRWSLLAAVSLSGFMLVRAILCIRRHLPPSPAADSLCGLMILSVVFGGSQLEFLSASIFQEITSWAAAFGMVFVYFAIKGLVTRNFDARVLCGLAVAAGFCVLTRVATGIGLCAAFCLLLLTLILQDSSRGLASSLFSKRILLPCALLALLLIVTGIVNYGRWGNPLTFADHRLYLSNRLFPDRLDRIRRYGYFNIRRLPFGLVYFFFPLWAFHAPNGALFFQAAQTHLLDAAELPPSSFFLTDLLPFVFMGSLIPAIKARRKTVSPTAVQAISLAVGLALPCALLLTSYYMAHRYRLDFYPEIEFLALLGLYVTIAAPDICKRFYGRRRWLIACLVIGVVSSCAVLFLYRLSQQGAGAPFLSGGFLHYYAQRLHSYLSEHAIAGRSF